MNSSLVVPALFARAVAEELQKGFTDGWDPLFIGYTAAVYFHTSEIKNKLMDNSSEDDERLAAPKVRGTRGLENASLEQEGLENMLPVWDDGRMIVKEGHTELKDEMMFATRKYRAPY